MTSRPTTAPPARWSVVLLAWVLATVLAATVAWWAVAVVGGNAGNGKDGVLSRADVVRALAEQRATSTPSPTPSPTAEQTSPPPPAPPVQQVVYRTWKVTGGQVSVSCSGAAISLQNATPEDGWTFHGGRAGPEEVEVEFHREGSETKVHVWCVDGTPQMTTDGGGDD